MYQAKTIKKSNFSSLRDRIFFFHLFYPVFFCLTMLVLPLAGEEWNVYTTGNSGLPNNEILSLAIDEEGVKWIGTMGGLARYDGTTWTVFNTTNSGLPSNTVRCILISEVGYIWIGTNSGLAVYDGVSQGQNPDQSWQGWTVYNMNNSGLPRNVVSALAVDDNNTYWIGTLGGGGLAAFDGVTWTVYTVNNSDLPNNFIYALEITENNLVWVGTNYGLAKFDGLLWTVYYTNDSPIPDNAIRSLFLDSNEVLYIGTAAGGLAIFNGASWTIYNQSNTPIPENSISSINVKDSGIIWTGTANNGLLRKNNSVWTLYNTTTSDIPSNLINAIMIEDGRLKWIGTDQGLVSYDQISVTGIIIEPATLILEAGESYQLSATITPDDASEQGYFWFSGDENLAVIEQDGTVTTLDTGVVTIFAETVDGGYRGECLINITGTVSDPIFSPPAGEYDGAIYVTISSSTPDAVIRYTLDGEEPTEYSPVFTEPILISTDTVISARGYKEYWIPSQVAVAEYFINTTTTDYTIPGERGLSCRVFPNPLYPEKGIRNQSLVSFQIYLPNRSDTMLEIFDLRGRKIVEERFLNQTAGELRYELETALLIDRRTVSGVYFYRLQTGEEVVTGRFTIIR